WGLARETGAGSILIAGKAGRGLAELGDRATDLMSFRYRSAEPSPLPKVELVSSRRGVSLDHPHGFRLRSPQQRVPGSAAAHLVPPPAGPDPLSLEVSLYALKADGAPRTRMVLRYVPPYPGVPTRPVELIAVGRDADGAWTRPIRWSGEASAVQNGAYEVAI